MKCWNSCGGDAECRRIDCCHVCVLFVGEECVNDGAYAWIPRYFIRAEA